MLEFLYCIVFIIGVGMGISVLVVCQLVGFGVKVVLVVCSIVKLKQLDDEIGVKVFLVDVFD